MKNFLARRTEEKKESLREGQLQVKEVAEPSICNGAFSVDCTSCKDPQSIVGEMQRALDIHKIQAKQVVLRHVND